jgi:hypothetical protein
MAVITYEEGNAVPIKTDTSHVFDVNGNPLHGELFIGETIASDDVEEIDGFAHESDLTEYQKKVWNLITTLSGTTGGSYPRTGDYTEMLVTITTTTNKINSVTLPFTDNFSGRISVTIDNGVYEIYFNGAGACQGSNTNATYRIYYR